MIIRSRIFTFVMMLNATSLANAACESAESRQFDFWLGTWEVTANNSPAGKNKIEKIQDGCVIRETWVSAKGGFTGTSYNYYDAQSGLWNQLWLDNQGGSLKLSGGLNETKMVLSSGPQENEEGSSTVNRITWTPNDDGTVRQLWEVVTTAADEDPDRSKSNTTVGFDGLYKQTGGN